MISSSTISWFAPYAHRRLCWTPGASISRPTTSRMMPRMKSKAIRGETRISDRLFISTSFQDAALFLACAGLLGIATQFGYPTNRFPKRDSAAQWQNHLREILIGRYPAHSQMRSRRPVRFTFVPPSSLPWRSQCWRESFVPGATPPTRLHFPGSTAFPAERHRLGIGRLGLCRSSEECKSDCRSRAETDYLRDCDS